MKETLSFLSGVAFGLAYIPYIIAIIKKKTKPARTSWIIWATLDTIAFTGMYVKGVLNGSIVAAVLGAWIIVILSLFFGVGGWSFLDKICFAGAALGLLLWYLFQNPTLGIIASMSVLFLGSFPTFKKTRKHPEQEDKTAWILCWIGAVLATIGAPALTTEALSQPLAFLIIESIMLYLLFVQPLREVRVRAS